MTYDLLEFGSDVGGVYEFVYVIGFLFTKGLLTYNYIALFAHRMYLWTPVDSNKSCCAKPSEPESKAAFLETPLEIPFCLEFWSLL